MSGDRRTFAETATPESRMRAHSPVHVTGSLYDVFDVTKYSHVALEILDSRLASLGGWMPQTLCTFFTDDPSLPTTPALLPPCPRILQRIYIGFYLLCIPVRVISFEEKVVSENAYRRNAKDIFNDTVSHSFFTDMCNSIPWVNLSR
jgi:hypothetical protein